ncbi:MAG: hypothetical protein JSW68_06855, partial [Burkholderiales bacterium]
WAALRKAAQSAEDADRFSLWLERWMQESRQAFLGGYEQAIAGAASVPSLAAVRPLLALFELEKVMYELRYEIGNRPDWVAIPLRGVLDTISVD